MRHGSMKCSCRWSTNSHTRPSHEPLTLMKSTIERCWTNSQRPTPPACGQTGTPAFAASRSTARFSFTPPSRQESIWQNEIARAWSSCLKRMRFIPCSPVATPTPSGSIARAIAACPSTSSGEVGSSIHHGRNRASSRIHAMACGTSQTWFASTISLRSQPISSRMIVRRRTSSARSRPTFTLMCVQPSATASRQRRRILSSG